MRVRIQESKENWRAKVVVGMEKAFCRTFRIGLGLALREGKKGNTKYTKQHNRVIVIIL